MRIKILLTLFSFFSILLLHPLYSMCAQKDIKMIVEDLEKFAADINTYHAILKTNVYSSCVYLTDLDTKYHPDKKEMPGSVSANTEVIGESGIKMNLKTVFYTDKIDITTKYDLIYDGTWLWVEHQISGSKQNSNKMTAFKIHIPTVSPDSEKEKFNAFMMITGIGLSPYKDLPGTFKKILNSYKFIEFSSSNIDGEVYILGIHKDCAKDNLKKKPNNYKNKNDVCGDELFCRLKVKKESKLITAISYGNSKDSICMNTDIDYISINKKLPKDIFTYQTRQDVSVPDITPSVLERKNKFAEHLNKKDP